MKPPRGRLHLDRRAFLAGTATAAFAVARPEHVFGSRANETLTFGLIGCGGRGGWIAELFQKTGKYRCVACADYFGDRAQAVGERLGVDPGARFDGLSGYKRLLERPCDVAVIETPPYFHPAQATDAVAAGKHVFLAKPIAVDVPGCLAIARAGEAATARKQVFLVDFQTRTDPHYQEVVQRVHQGGIGKLISLEARYPWSGSVHDEKPAETPDDRIRYWYQSRALCGDVIVEQDIHALDVATWFTGADPVKAYGTGGRVARKFGEIWDHFSVIYQFPGDIVLTFSSQKSVPGISDEIRCKALGTEGVADTDYEGQVGITGKNPVPMVKLSGLYQAGAQRNIDGFYDAVTGGRYDNPTVAPSVRSNLTCVLGRTAAYGGREVTWKDLIASAEPLPADLSGMKA